MVIIGVGRGWLWVLVRERGFWFWVRAWEVGGFLREVLWWIFFGIRGGVGLRCRFCLVCFVFFCFCLVKCCFFLFRVFLGFI